ncbi:MAG: PP2C family serine/threonine-protein phosphatase [Polyangiales bacterium]
MSAKKTLEFLRRPGDELTPTEDEGARATIAGRTDVGMVRSGNEDQFVVASLERTILVEECGLEDNENTRHKDTPTGRLMMVADGMGGQVHGEVASVVVVDAMMQYAFSIMPWLRASGRADDEKVLAEGLTRAVHRSQERMQEVADRKGYIGDMGSTLTMGYIAWPMLYLVHVGDSRAYLHRGGRLFRLTKDHNLAEEMVAQNVLTAEEARRSRFSSVLTNSVSTSGSDLRVELHQVELRREDRLLLCTDGLYGELTDEQIHDRLLHVASADLVAPAVESLVKAANKAGGKDNITAVLGLF